MFCRGLKGIRGAHLNHQLVVAGGFDGTNRDEVLYRISLGKVQNWNKKYETCYVAKLLADLFFVDSVPYLIMLISGASIRHRRGHLVCRVFQNTRSKKDTCQNMVWYIYYEAQWKRTKSRSTKWRPTDIDVFHNMRVAPSVHCIFCALHFLSVASSMRCIFGALDPLCVASSVCCIFLHCMFFHF